MENMLLTATRKERELPLTPGTHSSHCFDFRSLKYRSKILDPVYFVYSETLL